MMVMLQACVHEVLVQISGRKLAFLTEFFFCGFPQANARIVSQATPTSFHSSIILLFYTICSLDTESILK
jgi:hypothetical protein